MLNIVTPTVKRFTLYAHSEDILQTLLYYEDHKEKIEGMERIRAIRGEGD